MTGKELYEGRYFHRNQDRDWAFTRLDKISDNQAAFITKLCERDGTCGTGGRGIDFGGWSAWSSIVTALKRKGVLKEEGGKLILIEGEPIPYVEPMLPKPYMKVQRVLLDVFDGEQVSVQNQWLWLDPRGDMEFLVILPLEMAQVLPESSERTTMAAGCFCAHGKVSKEAINRASTLSREFMAVRSGVSRQVLLIEFETEIKDPGEQYYSKNGLMFSYKRMLYLGTGFLYLELPDGSLRQAKHVGDFDTSIVKAKLATDKTVIIDYTPEREVALESLRMRLVNAATDLQRILTADNFVSAIDSHGPRLLKLGSTSKKGMAS